MAETRVLTLMFHRINDASQQFHPQQFSEYLRYLVTNFPIVIPGEKLPNVPLAICLTFDDAYFDFYYNVFPLLQKYRIKALLAVPVKYIIETTALSPSIRLTVPYAHDMEDPSLQQKVPFCTWQELNEMQKSEHVEIASHGFRHANLASKKTDYAEEIYFSKQILQEKLNTPIHNFVYPFGRMTTSIHKKVCQIYRYGIRIGSALNLGWDNHRQFIYRINADPLWTTSQPISPSLIHKLTLKYWMNRLRLK